MRPEVLSTARPSRLRLIGFVALAAGALAAGVGSLLVWARIGFPADLRHGADVTVAGIDVWEGVVVLAIATGALVLLIATRVTTSSATRTILAGVVAAGGLVIAIVTSVDVATARSRFGGGDGLENVIRHVAAVLGQPVDRVRPLLERNFGSNLRVDIGPGLPISLLGGLLLVAAGVLAWAWAGSSAGRRFDPPAATDSGLVPR